MQQNCAIVRKRENDMSETLGEYVDRVMKQNGLTLRDVEEKSGKKITNSYISRLINGKVNNLKLDTIMALAEGLDVNPHDILSAASGVLPQGSSVDPLLAVDILQKLLMNPQLIRVVQRWLKLSAKEQLALLQAMEKLNEPKKTERTRKKKS